MLTDVKLNKAIRGAVNQRVVGSSPTGGVATSKGFMGLKRFLFLSFRHNFDTKRFHNKKREHTFPYI